MMLKLVLIGAGAWLAGIFGFAQIIGSLQSLKSNRKYWFTLILWTVILAVLGYIAVVKLDGLLPLAVGYGFALVMVIGARKGK